MHALLSEQNRFFHKPSQKVYGVSKTETTVHSIIGPKIIWSIFQQKNVFEKICFAQMIQYVLMNNCTNFQEK